MAGIQFPCPSDPFQVRKLYFRFSEISLIDFRTTKAESHKKIWIVCFTFTDQGIYTGIYLRANFSASSHPQNLLKKHAYTTIYRQKRTAGACNLESHPENTVSPLIPNHIRATPQDMLIQFMMKWSRNSRWAGW